MGVVICESFSTAKSQKAHFSDDYERDLKEQEMAISNKQPYDNAWVLRRKTSNNTYALTFWAVTASAAAWYLYSNSSTWMRFLG